MTTETFDYDQVNVAVGLQNPLLMLRPDGLRGGVVDTRFNANGSVYSQTTTAWSYDADGRLTEENFTVQTAASDTPLTYDDQFKFDLANNRKEEDITSAADPTGVILYTYNERDELLTETKTGTGAYAITHGHTDNSGHVVGGYDADGSEISTTRTGTNVGTSTYTWDLCGRMSSAS